MTPTDSDALERIFRDMIAASDEETRKPEFPGYELLEEIGDGGFGVVYRAIDKTLQREVALKLLLPGPGTDETARNRFLDEARALARVRHPNVLTIHGVLEHGDRMALCMEYVDGRSLNDVLERRGPLDVREAIEVGIDISRALGAVHAAGIVHRDVKSANVLRDRAGRTVLADFGLGVFASGESTKESWGSVVGSPAFMSPEQVRGGEVDFRSDLYSLGVLLYNLTTARFPFEGEDLSALFERITGGEPVPLGELRPDLPDGFVSLVMKAIARDPTQRFQSAAEMDEALVRCQPPAQGLPAAPGQGPDARRGTAAVRRRSFLFVLGCGLTVLAIAIALHSTGGNGFEIRARALIVGPAESSALETGRLPGRGNAVSVEVLADRDLRFYVVLEDSKARKYLLFPEGGKGSLLRATKPLRLPRAKGKKVAGWKASEDGAKDGGGEWLILIASIDPLGPLEDAIPTENGSDETGRDGYPRLKPVTVRGLARWLTERGSELRSERDEDPDKYLLAGVAKELEQASEPPAKADRIWIRKIRLQ